MMIPTFYYDFFNPDAPPQLVYIRVDNGPLQTRDLIEQWPIKKVLTVRDVNCSQILMPQNQVEDYILPRLLPEERNSINRGEPLQITVRDLDTLTEHRLCLWNNGSSSYVLASGWSSSFVWRRRLKVGEEVGFYWDQRLRELRFTVLSRPPVPRQE
ncbi:hypothetical protein NE237_011757 [Protea cynaroides]|uniref:TF-B3 domain-containing protein n=1 Tax=Protea cynaroides TaxID=273540 RepID=A0A9Q0GWN6_9MAGN|nr:hypothetical protein NE237_011757 [Protea cynaroides]